MSSPLVESPAPPSSDAPRYLDRELSLLQFQRRVLEEARDPSNPLLERVKFLSILGSNLDEFFMVRVAVLRQKVVEKAHDAEHIRQRLTGIRAEVSRLVSEDYQCLLSDLKPQLKAEGIELLDYSQLSARQREHANRYFHDMVFPVLTPLAVDQGRPFPLISNRSLNIAVVVRAGGQERFGRVKIPDQIPRLVPVPVNGRKTTTGGGSRTAFVWLEQLIAANLESLFPNLEICGAYPFRVTRDAEVEIKEVESDDLLETIEEAVWQRRFSAVIRLQVDEMPRHLLHLLVENLEMDPEDVYHQPGPLGLSPLRELTELDRPDLKDAPHHPRHLDRVTRAASLFDVIRQGDLLLHHPYDSFDPVVEFLRQAAKDPQVLAIKITLYRVGSRSPIVEALLDAVGHGKQVAVLVELKARFDEESNIEWARKLELEGVHVVYGLVGLKVHSKLALVVRREDGIMKRYVHLGTGNYNPGTARVYTDFSLFSCEEGLGADASDVFNFLTGYSAKREFRKLLVSPVSLRTSLEAMIRREMDFARRGEPARLLFKMNALEDREMIERLYEASAAGVEIDLIVRGICCLRPGVPGLSDRIRVRSIVGRFLEHARAYAFRNGGSWEYYLGSADLMPRNLNRRVEVVAPLQEPGLQADLHRVLDLQLADTRKAWRMTPDGTYVRDFGGPPVDSQAMLAGQ
jgi:polyphosphate kinase